MKITFSLRNLAPLNINSNLKRLDINTHVDYMANFQVEISLGLYYAPNAASVPPFT